MNDPLNPLVVTVGKITGGQRFNILADKVIMEGTTRTHSPEMRKKNRASAPQDRRKHSRFYGSKGHSYL